MKRPYAASSCLSFLRAFDRHAVDPGASLFRVHVEENEVGSAGLVDALDAVVAGVAIPDVGEPGDFLAFPDDDEVELELPRLLPRGHSAHRGDELLADGVGFGVALGHGRGRGSGPERQSERRQQRREDRPSFHGGMICPAPLHIH